MPFFNYSYGDLSMTHELLQHENTRNGLSDAGAHCGAICDGGMPTFLLTHWVRDRQRGPHLQLEKMVQRQTRKTAEVYGLLDLGLITPGLRADINLIDLAVFDYLLLVTIIGKASTAKRKKVDGNDLLYQLFKELLGQDQEIAIGIVREMISLTAVWFPTEVYQRVPILLPWVVRDSSCRSKNTKNGKTPEEWGSPNPQGFLRDDNSMIKGIPKSLKIVGSKNSPVNGRYVNKGFVASHVWREVDLEVLANKDPRLNSFIPNLVWLPAQISKLSDIEGGLVQSALKAVSWHLYRDVKIEDPLSDAIEGTWNLLPIPTMLQEFQIKPEVLNYFAVTKNFYVARQNSFENYTKFIYECLNGITPTSKNITSRYLSGLPSVDKAELIRTLAFVRVHTSNEMAPALPPFSSKSPA